MYRNSRGRLVEKKIPQAKLEPWMVLEIRIAYQNGATQVELAKLWDVSAVQIHRIISKKAWAHL